MSGRKSRDKGKRGEREVVQILKSLGFDAKRRGQLQAGREDVPDVLAKNEYVALAIEVKFPKKLPAFVVGAMEQAEKASGYGFPVVFMRENRGRWYVMMTLSRFLWLIGKLAAVEEVENVSSER